MRKRLHSSDKKSHFYKLTSFIILVIIAFSCSDSSTPVSPEPSEQDDETDTAEYISVQGQVSGPAAISNNQVINNEYSDSLTAAAPDNFDSPVNQDSDSNSVSDVYLTANSSLEGESSLAGVTVSAYQLQDYLANPESASLIDEDVTDSNGRFTLSEIETDTELIIIANTSPGLSGIVLSASDQHTVTINSSTTIVSIYWAHIIHSGEIPDEEEIQSMIETASSLLKNKSENELTELLTALIPDQIGEPLPDDLPLEIMALINELLGLVITSCEDIEFTSDSARPGSLIGISNLPEELGKDPLGWYMISGNDELYPAYLERLDENSTDGEFIVPVHPEHLIAGGEIQLIFSDEESIQRCSGITFDILPLHSAPGTFSSLIDNLETTAVEFAGHYGFTRDELLTTDMNQLEPYEAVLKSVLSVISGEDYPNNMRAILSGDAPNSDEPIDPDFLELYDALLAEYDIAGFLGSEFSASGSLRASAISVPSCGAALSQISTPAELDCWMNVNQHFEEFNGNQFETYFDIHSQAFALIGSIPDKRAEMVAETGQTYLQFTKMMLESFEYLYPAELLGIELEAHPLDFNEDEKTEGEWSAAIYAQPRDWEFDALLAVDALPISLGKGGAMISKFRGQSEIMQQLVEGTLDGIQGAMQETGIFTYDFEAMVYGPIDIDTERDSDYFNWNLNTQSTDTGGPPFGFTADGSGYLPKAAGVSELRVRTAGGDVFKGQDAVNTELLEVKAIEIEIMQDIDDVYFGAPFNLDVDDEIYVYADVKNAENTEVSWSVTPDDTGVVIQSDGPNHAYVVAHEPGTYLIVAESASRSGPRADNNPVRSASARVNVGGEDFSILPGATCVEMGETQEFIAEQPDGSPIDVNWSVSEGSISGSGIFTAPDSRTRVTVTAANAQNPDQTATAQVLVSNCACYWEIEHSYGGLTVLDDRIHVSRDEQIIDEISMGVSGVYDAHNYRIEFNQADAPVWGQTGTYNGSFWGWIENSLYVTSPNMTQNSISVTVTEFQPFEDEAIIEGSFEGAVRYWDGEQDEGPWDTTPHTPGVIRGKFWGFFTPVAGIVNCTGMEPPAY
jgi:hypothetical protein